MRRPVALFVLVAVVFFGGLIFVMTEVPAPSTVPDPTDGVTADTAEPARLHRRGDDYVRETVTGVIRGDGGRLLAGVRVWVDDVETVTDAQGHFAVPDLRRGRHRVLAGGGDHLAEETVIAADAGPVEVRLDRPVVREGTLELPPGVPREGIEITFRRRGGDVEQIVRTDAEGRFRADRLRSADHHVQVASQRVGERVFFRASVTARRFRHEPAVLAPIAGAAISGVVVAPDGSPVAAALVVARGKWPRGLVTYLDRAICDDEGRYEVIVPEGVTVDLLVSAADPAGHGDRFAATVRSPVEPPATDVEVRMTVGNAITGELRTADDSPVIGATLEFRRTRNDMSWVSVVRARTDRSGRFVARGLLASNVRVMLAEDDVAARALLLSEIVPAPSTGVVLHALASLTVRGRIVRPPDLADTRMSYGIARGGGPTEAWHPLSASGAFRVERRPPGTYEVRVRIARDDQRTCGTVEAGADPVDLPIPPRE